LQKNLDFKKNIYSEKFCDMVKIKKQQAGVYLIITLDFIHKLSYTYGTIVLGANYKELKGWFKSKRLSQVVSDK
jgi:hypothetical protein